MTTLRMRRNRRTNPGLILSAPERFANMRPTQAETCPKHGEPYVIRRGTNRCPKGRKTGRNCLIDGALEHPLHAPDSPEAVTAAAESAAIDAEADALNDTP